MVKITNTLGDVKIGKQGEVVYQRKYGEQIRRMASPKRAIPSQTQIAHRQLYRDALTWRSQLSLPNRRYLDGYCIANGVVDRYHIPLPWSRFALKVYLQKVAFVVIKKPFTPPPLVLTKYENYESGDNTFLGVYWAQWIAQTFTPNQTHLIESIILKLYRSGNPDTLVASIRDTDAGGYPTGEDLCSGTTPASTLPLGSPYEWREIVFTTHPQLQISHTYAIVLRVPGGTPSHLVSWRTDSTGEYTEGKVYYSWSHGTAWGYQPGYDMMFQEWGYPPTEPPIPGILHVRHPALLAVVHKRGELPINAYYNLSSLDNEYLTKQVGLDVLSGDKIEATTVAGILYKHQV